MAIGDPYVTLEALKLRLSLQDSVDDLLLQSAAITASRAVDGMCGRQFNDAGAVSDRVFYPADAYIANVDDFSTLTDLIVAADYSNTGVYGTIAEIPRDVQVEPLNGIQDGEPGWPYWKLRAVGAFWFPIYLGTFGIAPRAALRVTARWGWAAVPAEVVEATMILAAELFKLKDAPFGVAAMSQWGPMRVRDNPKVASLLDRFRRGGTTIAMVG